eukprot:jgi/Botrbrau1/5145/Bobra.0172s0017.1
MGYSNRFQCFVLFVLIDSLEFGARSYASPVFEFTASTVGNIVKALDTNVRLVISSNTLTNNGDSIDVSWDGVDEPRDTDIVVLYVPEDADPRQTAFSRWLPATDSASHLRAGSGNLRFQLLNYGVPMRFALLRAQDGGGWNQVAVSEVVSLRDPTEPVGIHLALTEQPGEVGVTWISKSSSQPKGTQEWMREPRRGNHKWTREPGRGTQEYRRECGRGTQEYRREFGRGTQEWRREPETGYPGVEKGAWKEYPGIEKGASKRYPEKVKEASEGCTGDARRGTGRERPTPPAKTYGRGDLCGAPANSVGFVSPGTQNTAILTGLLPDTTYYYKVGDVSTYFSPIFSFRSPPPLGPSSAARVVIFSGSGQATADGSLASLALAAPRAAAAASALAAQVASGASLIIGAGDLACTQGQQTAWLPFFHVFKDSFLPVPIMPAEGVCEVSGGECGVPYRALFRLPNGGSAYYSYSHGPAHFVHLDGVALSSGDTAQLRWLDADLSGLDRSKVAYVVVVTGTVIGGASASALDSTFKTHVVDLIVQGGHSEYARTISDLSTASSNAPVYLVTGNIGLASGSDDPALPSTYNKSSTLGSYLVLTADKDGLHVEARSALDGGVLDSFVIPTPQSRQ